MNNIIYDPNFIPNQPILVNNIQDERLIPFLGGALIGGLGGAAIANNQGYYGGGYYPYPYYYAQPVNYGYYYPNGAYYTTYPMTNTYQTNSNIKRN